MSASTRRRIDSGIRADALFMAEGGPVIVSGGRTLQLAIATEGPQATISLRTPENGGPPSAPLAVIASGPAGEIAQAYSDLCSDLASGLGKRQGSHWRTFSYGAVVGAVLAASVFGAVSASIVAGAWRSSNPAASEAMLPVNPAGIPAMSKLQDLMPALEEIQKHTPAAQKAGGEAPDAGQHERVAIPLPPDVVNPSPGLPAYVPPAPLAGKETGGAAAENAKPADEAPKADAAPEPAKDVNGKEAAAPEAKETAGTNAVSAAEPADKAAVPAVQGDKVDLGAAKAEKPPEEGKAAEGKEADGSGAKPTDVDPAEKAKAAAKALRDSGMTQSQAVDVLSQLEALGNMDPEKITPKMLSTLPHEVAKMLIDSGLVNEDDAPDGVQYSIIRVPESVVDKHRGEDGIADIPERNSWASTGNFVTIPLPGGGDIKTPDDLKSFHLDP